MATCPSSLYPLYFQAPCQEMEPGGRGGTPSPVTSASQASSDDTTGTSALTSPQTMQEALLFPHTLSIYSKTSIYSETVQGLLGKKSDMFNPGYYNIGLVLLLYFRSLFTRPPLCVLPPLGLWCCCFPALQLHSCHSGCWPLLSRLSPPSLLLWPQCKLIIWVHLKGHLVLTLRSGKSLLYSFMAPTCDSYNYQTIVGDLSSALEDKLPVGKAAAHPA